MATMESSDDEIRLDYTPTCPHLRAEAEDTLDTLFNSFTLAWRRALRLQKGSLKPAKPPPPASDKAPEDGESPSYEASAVQKTADPVKEKLERTMQSVADLKVRLNCSL